MSDFGHGTILMRSPKCLNKLDDNLHDDSMHISITLFISYFQRLGQSSAKLRLNKAVITNWFIIRSFNWVSDMRYAAEVSEYFFHLASNLFQTLALSQNVCKIMDVKI